ncbi:MAG: methyltransferase [Candidatus Aenigmarchaeota archaeon]|nr:methyltransferase [Candidatus Aenigmarchaeota archaeon]
MFYHKGITLYVPDKVYYPREDSLLLAGVLEKTKLKGSILDIGCGSGLLAIIMAKAAEVTAVDVCSLAVKTTLQNAEINKIKLKAIHSDLFSKVKGKFDLIVCNPPYLPAQTETKPNIRTECVNVCDEQPLDAKDANAYNDITYSGGEKGRTVITKFIRNVKKYLKKNGKILLLISSLTGEKEVLALFKENQFKTKIIARQKIPWEELMVIEAGLKPKK